MVQRDVFVRIVLVNVLHGTADDASALLPGLLVAQTDRGVQHIPEIALQTLAAQVDLRRGQPAQQRLPVQTELPHGSKGVDARAEDQIVPEHHGVDGRAEIIEEFRDKIINFFLQALLHKAGDDGRIQLSGVDGAVAFSRGTVLPEQVHGQDMLPRDQMAESERMADGRIALMQAAEPSDGGPDRHVPVDREIPAAAVPADGFDTLIGQRPDLLRRALDQNRVAQQAAAEQKQIRHADKGLEKGFLRSGEFFGIAGDAARHMNTEQDNVIAFRVQIDLQLLCLLIDFFHAQGAADQLLKEDPPGIGLVFPCLPCEHLEIFLLLPLLLNPAACLFQGLDHVGAGDGLEQILIDVQLDGLLRVLKIVISGQDDDPRVRKFAVHQAAQGEPVHERHFDVGDENIRTDSAHHGQGDFSVGGFPGEDKAVLFPRNHIPDSLPDDALIFHNKHFDRFHISTCLLPV